MKSAQVYQCRECDHKFTRSRFEKNSPIDCNLPLQKIDSNIGFFKHPNDISHTEPTSPTQSASTIKPSKNSLFSVQRSNQPADHNTNNNDLFSELDAHIDFSSLANETNQLAFDKQKEWLSFPTEMMIRILILQHLYNLSDESMEFHIQDRLSFRHFCKLDHSFKTPDAKTTQDFREWLEEIISVDEMLAKVQSQLKEQGFIPRGGHIVDPTLAKIAQAVPDPSHKEQQSVDNTEKTDPKGQKMPASWASA